MKQFDEIVDQANSEAVHDFRKSTRHLQTVVETCRIKGQSRRAGKLRRRLQKFRHVLGDWRDTDVLLDELRKLQRHHQFGTERPYWRALTADTVKVHRKAAKRFFRCKKSLKVKATASGLKKLATTECRSALFIYDLRSTLEERWEKWRTSIDDFVADNTAGGLHNVRIKSKGLRYAVKLALHFYPDRDLEHDNDWLKQIQDRVGAWHDEMTLGQHALETFSDLPRQPEALNVIRRIKEKEIVLAKMSRDFITSIRESSEYTSLHRRLSASVFSMTNSDATSGRDNNLSGPIR
jgi:CHAD domain-containing protein